MDSRVPLTDRECEVLCRLVEGDTNKQIAYQLKIGVDSVKQHISSIGKKLAASNRVQIAVTAVIMSLARPQFNGLYEYHSLNPSHSELELQASQQSTFIRLEATYSLPPPPPTDRPPWEELTKRETVIFRLFAEDKFVVQSNASLASHLNISIHTFRKHMRSIYNKTKCNNKIVLANVAKSEKETRRYRSE